MPEAEKPQISVVIATFNRAEWLWKSLEGFRAQTIPADLFEILVVDDFGADDLDPLREAFKESLPIRWIRHDLNRGLGAARHTGTLEAKGDVILWFDDDDRPHPELLAQHLATHAAHPEIEAAVLGHTAWDPELEVTPVMTHVTEIGMQYLAYPSIPPGVPLPWHCFWGGRASAKRALLLEHGNWDPEFRGLEDMELAYRLAKHGLKVYYNPAAIQYALRPLNRKNFSDRCFSQGQTIAHMMAKHPDPALEAHFGLVDLAQRLSNLEVGIPTMEENLEKLEALSPHQLDTVTTTVGDKVIPAKTMLHQNYQHYFETFRLRGFAAGKDPGRIARIGPPRNVLIVSPELPMWDRASGYMRLFEIIRMLREAGHHVTFIARGGAGIHDPAPYVRRLEALGVQTIPLDVERMREAFKSRIDHPTIDLDAILRGRRFDVAYLYFHDIARQYMPLIRSISPETRIIVDTVDLHWIREGRCAEFLDDDALRREAEETRRSELATYEAADGVIAITEADKAILAGAAPALKVETFPNVHSLGKAPQPFEVRRDIVFVGTFSHQPNVAAIRVFCADTWPLIADRLPDARLFIVGTNQLDVISSLADDRVIVTGWVPHTAPYLARCRVSIAPLIYGSGMKGMVGEAMAGGLPVVSSSIAAEGMGLVDGVDALIADSPADFADAVVRLYQDQELWMALSMAGLAKAQREWSPAAVAERLSHVLFDGLREEDSTTATKRVSIVIPCWNRADLTRQCLEALALTTPDEANFEVVLVDNGSTDDTKALFASLGGDVQVVTNQMNLGYAKACNQGARAATGEWLLFLNNDTEPHAGWLEAMVDLGQSEPDIGIVGAKLLYANGTIQHAGVVFTGRAEGKFITAGKHTDKDVLIDLLPYHLYRKMAADAPFVNKIREFQVVTGACMLIRKRLFEQLGGFDEVFLNGYEDVDLCLKALQAGYRILYQPAAVITHHESQSPGRHDKDLDNARIMRERWLPFMVADDERYYLEDGFVIERPQERLTIYRWNPELDEADTCFARGDWARALAHYEAYLAADPTHPGALIKVAVLRERLHAG